MRRRCCGSECTECGRRAWLIVIVFFIHYFTIFDERICNRIGNRPRGHWRAQCRASSAIREEWRAAVVVSSMNLSLNGDPWSKLLVDDTDVLDSDTARA